MEGGYGGSESCGSRCYCTSRWYQGSGCCPSVGNGKREVLSVLALCCCNFQKQQRDLLFEQRLLLRKKIKQKTTLCLHIFTYPQSQTAISIALARASVSGNTHSSTTPYIPLSQLFNWKIFVVDRYTQSVTCCLGGSRKQEKTKPSTTTRRKGVGNKRAKERANTRETNTNKR